MGEKENRSTAAFERRVFAGFRKDPIPVTIIEKTDQKGPRGVPRNGSARGHPMGSLNHVGRGGTSVNPSRFLKNSSANSARCHPLQADRRL